MPTSKLTQSPGKPTCVDESHVRPLNIADPKRGRRGRSKCHPFQRNSHPGRFEQAVRRYNEITADLGKLVSVHHFREHSATRWSWKSPTCAY